MSSLRRWRRGAQIPVLLSLLATAAGAQESADGQDQASAGATEAAAPRITFQVPLRGAPKMRVGGGVRSIEAQGIALNVFAPEEAGLTASPAPTLYWYLSAAVEDPVEIALTDSSSVQAAAVPLVEFVEQPPVARGVHAFSLADHGIVLKPGVEYQWFVAVVRDPAQRSKDVIAGGTIIYQPLDAELASRLPQAAGDGQAAVTLAQHGIWYDAIDDLSRAIAGSPADADVRTLRAELLEQVGLQAAARHDRNGG